MHNTLRGFQQVEDSPAKTMVSQTGGAKSGALEPSGPEIYAELAIIVAAWPTLPKNIRTALLILISAPDESDD
jgi:hypothetical protein